MNVISVYVNLMDSYFVLIGFVVSGNYFIFDIVNVYLSKLIFGYFL